MQIKHRCSAPGAATMLATLGAVLFAAGCGGGGSNGSTTPGAPAAITIPTPTHFTTIDGPGGGSATAPTTLNGISNGGAIVGFTTANGANANFVRTSAGTFTSLNLGDPAAGMANGVNQGGTVVGVANGSAFVRANGTQTALAPPNATASAAFGVSDGGVIVGQYVTGAAAPGFVDVNGTFTTVTPTATASVVNVQGVNNAGVAVGFYSAAGGTVQHGFLYNIATHQTTLLPDPNTARTQSGGLALTQFLGINDHNEAVGYYQTGNGSQFGFLFNTATQAYTFLDDPQAAPVNGVQITQITGVNNAGAVTGFYVDSGGVQHGFTATP